MARLGETTAPLEVTAAVDIALRTETTAHPVAAVVAAGTVRLAVAVVAVPTAGAVAALPTAAVVAVRVAGTGTASLIRNTRPRFFGAAQYRGKVVERNPRSRSGLHKQEAKHMSSMRVAAWFTWFAAWNWLVQTAMISKERFAKGVIRP